MERDNGNGAKGDMFINNKPRLVQALDPQGALATSVRVSQEPPLDLPAVDQQEAR